MSFAATLSNTPQTYGAITKTFHWLTALLILTAFPVGIIAHQLPYDTSAQLATKALLFSVHKTVGVTAFFVALTRIVWALIQPKPGLLHPDRKAEAFAAELVHWMLYGSMVLVPLSGWIHHAATSGFAPIWWPFGQDLPFVPKDAGLAHLFGSLHGVFTKVFMASIVLHIAGAAKHHVIDRDETLRRMLPGRTHTAVPEQAHTRAPLYAAIFLWLLAMTGGSALGLSSFETTSEGVRLDAAPSDWVVQEGRLALSVRQFGTDVDGQFTNWTAVITFDPEARDEIMGNVTVDIAVGSLSLGSVTTQALGVGFLDTDAHPTASFVAQIRRDGAAYVADGTLTLVGQTAPIALPFTLELNGDTAIMRGETVIDRRAFGIGMATHGDEANLGFPVQITVELTATRSGS